MILPTWPRELLLCLHSQVSFLLVNEWEWAKAVQKFSSALQPFNVIQPKVFCSCSVTHDTPSDQLVYLFLACLLTVHPAIQTGTIGTFLHVRSHILLFFMYKIAQISGIKNTQKPTQFPDLFWWRRWAWNICYRSNLYQVKNFNLGWFSISFVS